ncbi:hypothetical protein L7F22_041423 [Adiantum nelumboides]|nr:hypothetical protein [Adiantum nelumboides]
MEILYSVANLKVLERLGEGSFGRVFRVQLKADDEEDDPASSSSGTSQFACKVFDGDVESNLHEIVQEISIMQTLRNAMDPFYSSVGLVNIHGFHLGLTPKDPVSFITMDLCMGDSLSHLLQLRTSLSEAEAALVLSAIARGLLFCHQQARILHRDVKPANILFAEEGCFDTARLADFGLAVHMTERFDVFYGPPGEGSRAFMAPEAEEDGQYSPASDVWGLGAVLFCMLVGKNPVRPRGSCEVQFEKAGDAWTSLSSHVCNLIKGMLCPEPHLRLTLLQVLQHPWTMSHVEHDQLQPYSTSKVSCSPAFNNVQRTSNAAPHCPPGFNKRTISVPTMLSSFVDLSLQAVDSPELSGTDMERPSLPAPAINLNVGSARVKVPSSAALLACR